MTLCVFCADLNSLDIVFDDARAAVVLHDDRAVRGHAMVVWKRHVENVADLDPAEAAHWMRIHQAAERALLDVTGCERAVLMKLGIATPHLHLHIYPVSSTATRADVMDAIEGRRREPRDSAFVTALRDRLRLLLDSTRAAE